MADAARRFVILFYFLHAMTIIAALLGLLFNYNHYEQRGNSFKSSSPIK